MKSFQTLRGFYTGQEPPGMEARIASGATLRLVSEAGLDFEEIEAALGLAPTEVGRRGEKKGRRSPPNKHDVWLFRAPVAPEAELNQHIDALWALLKPNVDYLKRLKSKASVDVFLTYSSGIDHGGVSVPFRSLEMFCVLEIDFGLSIVVLPESGSSRER